MARDGTINYSAGIFSTCKWSESSIPSASRLRLASKCTVAKFTDFPTICSQQPWLLFTDLQNTGRGRRRQGRLGHGTEGAQTGGHKRVGCCQWKLPRVHRVLTRTYTCRYPYPWPAQVPGAPAFPCLQCILLVVKYIVIYLTEWHRWHIRISNIWGVSKGNSKCKCKYYMI